MNTERDKFLTEAMGLLERWHDGDFIRTGNSINFSTWQGFGELWEWSKKQEWWYEFWKIDFGISIIKCELINPNNFANAVYNFLKER